MKTVGAIVRGLAASLALTLLAGQTLAQSVAAPVVTGYLKTTGCPPGYTSCFSQFGAPASGATAVIVPSGLAANGIAPSVSGAAESCHTYKASAGNGYDFSGYVGAATWVMLFDLAAPPSNGAVTPKAWAYAPAAGSWSISYGIVPAVFTAGIIACASSTGPLTLTLVSTNNVFSGRVQ
jgi:hypothetical protein